MKPFQPLLATTAEDLSALRYPLLASPKLDGIRCVIRDGKALTRKLKPIPNDFVRNWLGAIGAVAFDGELMLRDHRTPFNDVSSAIMSKGGEPDFVYNVFDVTNINIDPDTGESEAFIDRFEHLRLMAGLASQAQQSRLKVVPHILVEEEEELRCVIAEHIAQGYEGTMLRDPHGRYKFGRSTLKEGILLKIKPWFDEEATVVDVVEQMENQNEATLDERGYAKRSSAKAGKVGKGVLGTLVCVTDDGVQFEIGTGFTDEQRREMWERHEHPAVNDIVGRVVKFKHLGRMPGTNCPRGPAVFLGWRLD